MKLTPEQAADVAAMSRFVHFLIHRRFFGVPSHIDRDDLHQAAMVALCVARPRFDPSRGYAWGTFARHRIIGAIRDYLRTQRNDVSLDELIESGHDDTLPPSQDARLMVKDMVRAGNQLPKLQRRAFALSMIGLTGSEIARIEGVTESAVNLRLVKARRTVARECGC